MWMTESQVLGCGSLPPSGCLMILISCYSHRSAILSVSVCLCFYKRRPQTEWLLNNRNLFCSVPDCGKSKTRVLVDLMSGEGLLPGSWIDIFYTVLTCWKGKRNSLRSLL